MYNKMQDDGIQVDKMLALIQDGPNVNKTIFQKMNELTSGDHPGFRGLIGLGSCTLQTVHNVFGKVLNNMERTLTTYVWIFTLFLSTVLQEGRITKTSK